jgi:AbiU2
MSAEREFARELEIFRTEAEGGAQFFYAYLTLHAVAADNRSVHHALNRTPLFWNSSLGALQTATVIALGRVFDQQPPHNTDRVLKSGQDHPDLISKESLATRKQGTASTPPERLRDSIASAYEPNPDDFRRLRSHVKR